MHYIVLQSLPVLVGHERSGEKGSAMFFKNVRILFSVVALAPPKILENIALTGFSGLQQHFFATP